MPGGFRSGDVVLFPWSQNAALQGTAWERAWLSTGAGGRREELQKAGCRVAFCIYRARSGGGGGAVVQLSIKQTNKTTTWRLMLAWIP